MTKTIALMLLAAFIAIALLGCSGSENDNTYSQDDIDAKFALRISVPTLPTKDKPDETICTDYTDIGLLRICYVKEATDKFKLQVLKDGNTVVYNLKADGSIEDFSLQFGSGEYTARIMQNLKDDQYLAVETKTFTVTLTDDTSVYLNSIQNVNWNTNMPPIKDVKNIIASALENASDSELPEACINELYMYICQHITYDNDKVYDLEYDYTPDIEQTYSGGKGICYDYSSLLASMLRSVGIPAKLVKGYASYNPTVYHAWNEVYLNGEWHVIDATLDASTGVYEPMFKDAADYTKVSEY